MSVSPPPDDLRALLELEREAWVEPDAAARARLAARLDLSHARAEPVDRAQAAPTPKPRLPWGAATGLVAAGFGAGALVHSLVAAPVQRVEVRYVDRVVEVPAPPPPTPALPPPAEPAANAPPDPGKRAAVRDRDLEAESLLLDRARSALSRGDPQGALRAVSEHERRFPRGQLLEAREALSVQALVDAGRLPEAEARAKRFHAAHPGSPYAPVVDAALAP